MNGVCFVSVIVRSTLGLAVSLLAASNVGAADRPSQPVFIYGSLSGRPTLDRDAQGGNPFATAFVQSLALESASFGAFAEELIRRTGGASRGIQHPEVLGGGHLPRWQFLPRQKGQMRVALVVTFSGYAGSDVGPSLPGVIRDRERVSKALTNAGFAVTRIDDPDAAALTRAIASFQRNSAAADVALIYTTGHGVEIDGVPRVLLPYSRSDGTIAMTVTELARAARAREANLIFYAARRNRG